MSNNSVRADAEHSVRPLGFTLIETLIALFIFSFGLLGIAALQVVSLQRTFLAYLQSAAVSQLLNGKERMFAGHSSQELQLWNAQNSKILPEGRGYYLNGVVKICWYSKVAKQTKCLQGEK